MKTHLHVGVCSLLCLASGLVTAPFCSPTQAQTIPTPHPLTPPVTQADLVPADLTQDARLDRVCSVHEVGLPMDEVLHGVSNGEVTLSADRTCDALKLHLRLVKRPLRQLMNALAQLVPGAWYKTSNGKGYVLRMNPQAIRRRQIWWELFLAERQNSQALSAAALQAMRARPTVPDNVESADGNHEKLRQMILAGPTFFNLLPLSLQEKVAGSINDTIMYQEGGIIAATGLDEGAVLVPFADLPPQAQKMFAARVQKPLDNAYVIIENTGCVVSANITDANGEVLSLGFDVNVPVDTSVPALEINHAALLKRVQQMGKDAPVAWKELAVYQQSRVWPNALPPLTLQTNQRPDGEHASVWEELAQEHDMEFVADYYSRPGEVKFPLSSSSQPLPKPPSRPLPEELNKQALALDQSWKQTRDGVYLFRNNRWYRDDLLEVPAPLLRRWTEQYARAWLKELPISIDPKLSDEGKAVKARRLLDWRAEVVTTLTPWQIFSGLKHAAVPYVEQQNATGKTLDPVWKQLFIHRTDDFVFTYHTDQFYAGLNADQRTDLLAGRLDAATLTAEQQQQALYLQPRLAIALSRLQRPVLLGLRPRAGNWELMRLVVPSLVPDQSMFGGLPSPGGQ